MENKFIDYCGTPNLNALFDAQDAYHAGKPIPTGIEVEELTINVHEDKIGSIHMETTNGKKIEFDIPKMTVEGTGEEIITVDDGFLEQLSALPPQLARLKVRRFAFRENHFNSIFEILRFALWTNVFQKSLKK